MGLRWIGLLVDVVICDGCVTLERLFWFVLFVLLVLFVVNSVGRCISWSWWWVLIRLILRVLFVWGLVFDYVGFVLYCNYCLLVLQVLVVGGLFVVEFVWWFGLLMVCLLWLFVYCVWLFGVLLL